MTSLNTKVGQDFNTRDKKKIFRSILRLKYRKFEGRTLKFKNISLNLKLKFVKIKLLTLNF